MQEYDEYAFHLNDLAAPQAEVIRQRVMEDDWLRSNLEFNLDMEPATPIDFSKVTFRFAHEGEQVTLEIQAGGMKMTYVPIGLWVGR